MAPVKLLPLMVTCVPIGPLIGVKESTIGGGGGVTVKSSVLVEVPPEVVTLIFPLLAPAGTVARISVSETLAKLPATPLNFTCEASVKLLPLMVTSVPYGPSEGAKDEMAGGGGGAKLLIT